MATHAESHHLVICVSTQIGQRRDRGCTGSQVGLATLHYLTSISHPKDAIDEDEETLCRGGPDGAPFGEQNVITVTR